MWQNDNQFWSVIEKKKKRTLAQSRYNLFGTCIFLKKISNYEFYDHARHKNNSAPCSHKEKGKKKKKKHFSPKKEKSIF